MVNLYAKIHNIMSESGWVEKDGEVNFGKTSYAYASEAAFIRVLRPLLIKYKLIILPVELKHDLTKEGSTYQSSVHVTYRIADVESGEYHDIPMVGVGLDNGDKAVYKAMTGCFRTMLRQSFVMGTGDDPEASDIEQEEEIELTPFEKAIEYSSNTHGITFTKSQKAAMKDLQPKQIVNLAKAMANGVAFEEGIEKYRK